MKVKTKIHPELDEVFEYIGKRVQCVEDDTRRDDQCGSCAFHGSLRCDTICCAAPERTDMRDVHFEKVD